MALFAGEQLYDRVGLRPVRRPGDVLTGPDLLAGLTLIDGHQHFWDLGRFPYRWLRPSAPPARFGDKASISRDYLPGDYLSDMAGLPLAASVHVQANCGADDPVEETRWLQDLSDRTGWPAAAIAEIDLAAPDAVALIDRHRAFPILRGVRTPVAWDEAGRWRVAERAHVLADPGFGRAAEHLARHELCLEIVIVPEQMAELARFAGAHPGLGIVINHFGTLEPDQPGNLAHWRDGITALAARSNVRLKLSGLWTIDKGWNPAVLKPHVDHALAAFGAGRVLYGSNMPVEGVNCPPARQFAALAAILGDRPRGALAEIFGLTAGGLYRIGAGSAASA